MVNYGIIRGNSTYDETRRCVNTPGLGTPTMEVEMPPQSTPSAPVLKRCSRCSNTKPPPEFYSDPRSSDGLRSECKSCTLNRTQKYKQDHKEEVAERDRRWRKANPDRVQASHLRSNGKRVEAARQAVRDWRAKYPERNTAHNKLARAVRSGRIQRPSECVGCGVVAKLHGHHYDYAKPLDVYWLCPTCHRDIHAGFPTKNGRVIPVPPNGDAS